MAGRARQSAPLHDPLDTLRVETLHRSASVSIYDVRCRPHHYARSAEEWSRSNQIVFPRHGVFEREVRGKRVMADANHALFFSRDEAYHVSHPARCGDDCTVFAFDDGLLLEAASFHDPGWVDSTERPFRFTHALNDQAVFFLHHQIARASNRDALALEEAAVRLLGALLRSAYLTQGVELPTHREQIHHAKLFLATRFRENLSLDAISGAVHCSRFHLARQFRKQAGVTLHQYRHRLRLREALRRVADGEADLSALALDLGFASHSHLTDSFRVAFGLPPRACRQALSSRRLRELSKNLEVATPSGA